MTSRVSCCYLLLCYVKLELFLLTELSNICCIHADKAPRVSQDLLTFHLEFLHVNYYFLIVVGWKWHDFSENCSFSHEARWSHVHWVRVELTSRLGRDCTRQDTICAGVFTCVRPRVRAEYVCVGVFVSRARPTPRSNASVALY